MKTLAFAVSIFAFIYVLFGTPAKALDRVDLCIQGANRVLFITKARDAGVSHETYRAAVHINYARNIIDEYYAQSAIGLAQMVYHPALAEIDGETIAEMFYQECVKEPV